MELVGDFTTAAGAAEKACGKKRSSVSDLTARFNGTARAAPAPVIEEVGVGVAEGASVGELAAKFTGPAKPASKQEIAHAFGTFLTASSARDIQQSFDKVLNSLAVGPCRGQPVPPFAELCSLLEPLLPHRPRTLLQMLGAWLEAHAPASPAALKAVVIGAGPIGLRAAIELAARCSEVTVLEQRSSFTRVQIVHIWDYVERDLIEMGVKVMDPSIFAAADLRRVQISQLQHSLLKVACLLGVKVRFGVSIDSLASLTAGRRSPVCVTDVLVDASGARCALLSSLGFNQTMIVRSASGAKSALCIVISLVNRKSALENELRESTWSAQYFPPLFGKLAQEHGVVLENFVYYRSTGGFSPAGATHYFLMATDVASLHAFGALIEAATIGDDGERSIDPCRPSNVRLPQLEDYARRAIGTFVPALKGQEMIPGELRVFDFSERWQSNRAAAVVDAVQLGGTPKKRVLVTRVGDALQEPFWPEGLGINRGLLHVYDCADLVNQFSGLTREQSGGTTADERCERMLRRREHLFALTKVLGGHNRLKELRPHLDAAHRYCFGPDPHTRYTACSANGLDGAVAAAPSAAPLPTGSHPAQRDTAQRRQDLAPRGRGPGTVVVPQRRDDLSTDGLTPRSAYQRNRKLQDARQEHDREVALLSTSQSILQPRGPPAWLKRGNTVAGPTGFEGGLAQMPATREEGAKWLMQHLAAPAAPGGALTRLQQIGSVCERVGDGLLDFYDVARRFAAGVDWSRDDSCGDIDIFQLLEIIEAKSAGQLREAVEECIEDGGVHLRPVLDLPHGEMGAAFFLEVLEAAAAAAAEASA